MDDFLLPQRFVKVYFNDQVHGAPRRPVMLHVIADGPKFLHGWQVDSEGANSNYQHLIAKDCIARLVEYRQSAHYGTLERLK